jgi:sucrose phosphorylase
MDETIMDLLTFIYGPEPAAQLQPRLEALMQAYGSRIKAERTGSYFGHSDALLITYGDMVRRQPPRGPDEPPLRTLAGLLDRHLRGVISIVHLLPFCPYTSDDGYSVVDYKLVDPALGDWPDVAEIGRQFRLMFDAVVNHISASSDWFQRYLQDDPAYRDYFITVDPALDLSAVFRPRALPLLTEVQTAAGPRHVWTTFSTDQIDLNFANPEVMLAMVDVLLFYVAQGADLIRLDAIAFMWKEFGTNCLHLPEAHSIIQLWRRILDIVAPQTAIVTETNVPHLENISYFGDGRNEAQMVYNFSLPPLTLHAFHTGNAEILSAWAQTLSLPSDTVTFLNFLASHDGIGVTPARGYLPESEVAAMAERVLELGGQVSYRNMPDGSRSAYELNINYLDALGDPAATETDKLRAERFLAAQAIMLSLRGVPGIYFHSLFGSRGWPEGAEQTGRARTINRQKVEVEPLEAELATAGSLRQLVFSGYRRMLQARAESAAFHPNGEQEILNLHPAVFAVRRSALDGGESVLCLQNVSAQAVDVHLPMGRAVDLISGRLYPDSSHILLSPYQVLWLREEG